MDYHPPTFTLVAEKPDFAGEELKILSYWEQIDAFQTSLKMSEGRPEYSFYDGPPFATGTPHYGHITVGTIKDVVTRYAHQNGFHVERRFGWDCHGLPIEFEINKQYGIKTKKDVLEIGIPRYNELCRSIVMRYSGVWKEQVTRLGRWIDFDNDYKTMDLNFMESCWWVFKQIWDKGLVYSSCRVMPYSCGCNSVLSNFEATLNYKDVQDPSVVITFPLLSDPQTSILAWTTTPWTLPTNLAVAVRSDFTYVKFRPASSDQTYIVCQELLPKVLEMMKVTEYEALETLLGEQLVGLEYQPLFEYFVDHREKGCFRVYSSDHVTAEAGTGIVHLAPFGEEDFALFLKHGLVRPDCPPDPLDENGHFTAAAPDLEGMYFKDANRPILKKLKADGRLVFDGQLSHSYPHCWRSDSPLIYRPVKGWFMKVESIKEDLLRNNLKATWVPAFVQEKRFHNWLADAQDWCLSRSRFWGNPIPLWVSEDGEEVLCVESVQQLKDLTGATEITDLHREHVDGLTIISPTSGKVLRRIEEVFDCWYESGSMPFAHCHYPFDISEEDFAKRFPADFIAEGLDQTRGWFYTLNVVSTALRNEPPFKNLIVNGLVAEDGQKMSQRKKNYTDPMLVVDEFGADAVRLYLVSSPLVRAEPVKFVGLAVKHTVRDVFLPWYNVYRFLTQNATRYETETGDKYVYDPSTKHVTTNLMDRWVLAETQALLAFVRNEMDHYRLYTVIPELLHFLNSLTNWYVRLNRSRLKGEVGRAEWKLGLDVLFDSVLNLSILMAPFTPFITEMIYQNLRATLPEGSEHFQASIHFVMIPHPDQSLNDPAILRAVSLMQNVIELARRVRDQQKISPKRPVKQVVVIQSDLEALEELRPLLPYVNEELNTWEILLEQETSTNIKLSAEPNHRAIGKRLNKAYSKELKAAIAQLTKEELIQFESCRVLRVGEVELLEGDLEVQRQYEGGDSTFSSASIGRTIVAVDTTQNEMIIKTGAARELANRVQKLRKSSGLNVGDDVELVYQAPGPFFTSVLESTSALLNTILKIPILAQADPTHRLIAEGEVEAEGEKLGFALYWRT
jgi:isoleucyl-tRNA synthetase